MVYYVSTEGLDLADGSSGAPFRTISTGMGRLRAGDALVVRAGDYGDEHDLDLTADGAADAPIVIRSETPGGALLRGPRPANHEGDPAHGVAFHFNGRSHWIVDGFDIRNYFCGLCATGGHHHTVRNTIFAVNGGQGASHRNDGDVLYQSCRFLDFHRPNYTNTSHTHDGSELIYAISDYGVNFYSSKRVAVQDCYFYGNHHQGVSFKQNNEDCAVRRCVWEGALHHAVILGQGLEPGKHSPGPFVVEDCFFRPARRHRLKEAIAVYNVSDVTIRRNYIEGAGDDRVDHSANGLSSGIHVRADAGTAGTIRIFDNVLRDGLQEKPAILVGAPGARYEIIHNTLFNHEIDFACNVPADHVDIRNNLSVSCRRPLDGVDPSNGRLMEEEAAFVGPLTAPPLADDPPHASPTQAECLDLLVRPFGLGKASRALGRGRSL